jgi:non-heme chloroperoxidase
MLSSRLVKDATLKIYPGAPYGLATTHEDKVSAELLAFLKV